MVKIPYEKKYRKWVERLGICVSDEEFKKGMLKRIELMGMMLKYWTMTKTWLSSKLTLKDAVQIKLCFILITRMWANAKRDGRSAAEYRWCPLFNAAKFG